MFKYIGLILFFSLSACQSRYGYLPRTGKISKNSESKSTWDHFVVEGKSSSSELALAEKYEKVDCQLPDSNVQFVSTKIKTGLISVRKSEPKSHFLNHKIDVNQIDTNQFNRNDKDSNGNPAVAFGLMAGINLLWIFSDYFTGVAFAIIILLGLIAVIYLSRQLVLEMTAIRLSLSKAKKKYAPINVFRNLRKFANHLLLFSGALFAFAIILLLGSSFQGASIFAALATTFLFIGFILQLIALIGKFMY